MPYDPMTGEFTPDEAQPGGDWFAQNGTDLGPAEQTYANQTDARDAYYRAYPDLAPPGWRPTASAFAGNWWQNPSLKDQISTELTNYQNTPGSRAGGNLDPDYWMQRIAEDNGAHPWEYWVGRMNNPADTGGGGLGDFDTNRFTAPYTGSFTPPGYTKPPPFTFRAEDFQTDPGYEFRLGEGRRALEQSAAGRGVLNDGGTAKAINRYGQSFASNEYGNVYNRKAGEYAMNYGTQYTDPYDRAYRSALDQFTQNYNVFRNNQSDPFNKIVTVSQF